MAISLDDLCRTGPGTISGRYLRKFWHPVLRAEDLPAGCALPLRVMSEDFTIYRGETGTPHVVGQRCPHRGTQLSVGWVEGDTIRCRYHGWRFDQTGQCVEIPASPAEYAKKMKVGGYPTVERLGLIYAYFGESDPPPFHFPDFIGDGLIENRVQDLGCNFLQSYENDWDLYHAAWTHRTGAIHMPPDRNQITYEEADYGVIMRNVRENGLRSTTVLMPPTTVRLPVPTHNALAYRGAGPAWRDTYISHTPIDDDRHLVFITQQVRVKEADRPAYRKHFEEYLAERKQLGVKEVGEDIVAGKAFFKDYLHHPNLVTLEDYIAQIGQGRIVDRSKDNLARSDRGVILLRQILVRELQALQDGKPIKQWSVMTERPDAEIIEAVLNNPGTGARKAIAKA
jgi:5,5'-dehydrodivanillate O-demethylase oxygenase subunit